jgi:hypothetical protein
VAVGEREWCIRCEVSYDGTSSSGSTRNDAKSGSEDDLAESRSAVCNMPRVIECGGSCARCPS